MRNFIEYVKRFFVEMQAALRATFWSAPPKFGNHRIVSKALDEEHGCELRCSVTCTKHEDERDSIQNDATFNFGNDDSSYICDAGASMCTFVVPPTRRRSFSTQRSMCHCGRKRAQPINKGRL